MKIRIKDGRPTLWRWDTGRAVFVEEVENITRLDFNQKRKLSISVNQRNADGSWNVPNLILTNKEEVEVIAVYLDEEGVQSMESVTIQITDRAKPSDYIYAPEEVNSFIEAIRKVKEIVTGVNKVNLQTYQVEDGARIVATDREGNKTSAFVKNGRDGVPGKDYVLTETDKEEIASRIHYDDTELREKISEKMTRYIIRLIVQGTIYSIVDMEGNNVSFASVMEKVRDTSVYVVCVYGNSKLRPQYVGSSEIVFTGLNRDSSGADVLRMIVRPTGVQYDSIGLAKESDLEQQKENIVELESKKVGYSEVSNGKLMMYADDTKTVLLAELDLPTTDLTDYVKKTNYATSAVAGVVKTNQNYGTQTTGTGIIAGYSRSTSQYSNDPRDIIISKGTLENIGDDFVARHSKEKTWVTVLATVLTEDSKVQVSLSEPSELLIVQIILPKNVLVSGTTHNLITNNGTLGVWMGSVSTGDSVRYGAVIFDRGMGISTSWSTGDQINTNIQAQAKPRSYYAIGYDSNMVLPVGTNVKIYALESAK